MLVNVKGTTLRLIQLYKITLLAGGCMALSNRQLTSQLEAIDLKLDNIDR